MNALPPDRRCPCHGAQCARTEARIVRIDGLVQIGTELAMRVADNAMAEMDAAGAALEAALAAPPTPPVPPDAAPPPAVQAATVAVRARPLRAAGEPGKPPADPPPSLARRRAARLGPAAWNVLFSMIAAEVRRLIGLAIEVEAARTTGRPLRPAEAPERDADRFERVRILAREAAAADPGLQDLLARVDDLIDQAAAAGPTAGGAPSDLAARICAELGIALRPEGQDPEARPDPGPDPP